jgi:hypothetical protein
MKPKKHKTIKTSKKILKIMQAKQKNKNLYLQNAIKMFKANSLIMKKYLHFYQKE